MNKGFSLLEILIVMAVMAIIAGIGSGFYSNYNKNIEIKSVAEILLSDLKQTQSKSMIGENDSTGANVKWGVHFVNGATDYYEIFSTPTDYANAGKIVTITKYLPNGITFSDPATTEDIIFNRISGGTTASSISLVSQNITKTINITNIGNINEAICGNSVVGIDALTYGTVLGEDGECWLDRNLGATRVATAFNDTQSYGHLYQWGRGYDGHQITTSGTTATLSSNDTVGHGNFITNGTSPFNWRNPQNNSLWQGVSGVNNPCPSGFRLPTSAEWQTWITALGGFTTATCGGTSTCQNVAFNSSLKIPVTGYRTYSSAVLSSQGGIGYYWSSSISGTGAFHLYFSATYVVPANANYRALGYAVRCIKD